ncbi:MAG TPA: methyltransferase [Burkholderiaceae bacterium]|nr:methyltransferase [Burkholderiaceae bacterium]
MSVAQLLWNFPSAVMQWAVTVRGVAHVGVRMAFDAALFVKALRKSPSRVGAVLPSSSALANAITSELDSSGGPVLELGVGTGVFTRKMLEIGVPPEDLILVELDSRLADNLRYRFPASHVLCADASRLYRSAVALEVRSVVCGLPLRNMSVKCKLGILRSVFEALDADGAMYLFSYGLRCPIEPRLLDRLGLRARRTGIVYRNAPPARVWKISRRARMFKR